MSYVPLTYSECQAKMRKARNGRRKLQNNTYLYERCLHDDNGNQETVYSVRLHNTYVVTIHPDHTFTLSTGGWDTVTTKSRINGWSPARIYSVDGGLCVIHADDPVTEPKMRKCRACKGTGTDHKCHRCDGSGQADYGSKPRHVLFYDGIRVDADGKCIDPDAARWPKTQAEIDARKERARIEEERRKKEEKAAQAKARKAWFADLTPAGKGEFIVYKAVSEDLRSGYAFQYPIGETVTCEDWHPSDRCGFGLHFCANPRHAKAYYPGASRFLACAVKASAAIVIGAGGSFNDTPDKIKAKSARVLWEVDIEGNRIAPDSVVICIHCGKRLTRDIANSTDVWYAEAPDPGTASGNCEESASGAHEA